MKRNTIILLTLISLIGCTKGNQVTLVRRWLRLRRSVRKILFYNSASHCASTTVIHHKSVFFHRSRDPELPLRSLF